MSGEIATDGTAPLPAQVWLRIGPACWAGFLLLALARVRDRFGVQFPRWAARGASCPELVWHLLGDVGAADVRSRRCSRGALRGERLPQGQARALRQVNAYNANYGKQTVALSFIVQRQTEEPGFRLERQEWHDRAIRYTLHPYAADKLHGERYDGQQ